MLERARSDHHFSIMDRQELLKSLNEKIKEKLIDREQTDAEVGVIKADIEKLKGSMVKKSAILILRQDLAKSNASIQLMREKIEEIMILTHESQLKGARLQHQLGKNMETLKELQRLVITSKARLDNHCMNLLDEYRVPEERLQMALAEHDSLMATRMAMSELQETERVHNEKVRTMRMKIQALQRQLKGLQAELSKCMSSKLAKQQSKIPIGAFPPAYSSEDVPFGESVPQLSPFSPGLHPEAREGQSAWRKIQESVGAALSTIYSQPPHADL